MITPEDAAMITPEDAACISSIRKQIIAARFGSNPGKVELDLKDLSHLIGICERLLLELVAKL